MRSITIMVVILLAIVTLGGVASASVRNTVAGVAGEFVPGTAVDPAPALPSPSVSLAPSASPSPAETTEPENAADDATDDADDGDRADSHGAAVSAVAQDPDAVGTKVLSNGKVITNHGQAVSAVARSNAGKGNGKGDD